MTLHESITMGGYGMYVWPAYAITLSVFAMNIILSLREKQQITSLVRQQWLRANPTS